MARGEWPAFSPEHFLGLIPLDETTQVRMIKLLLEHGADETRAVENYKPVDLLRPDRVYAQAALRRQNYGPRNQDHQRYLFLLFLFF